MRLIKKICVLFLLLPAFTPAVFSQADNADYHAWQHPVIKKIQAKDPNILIYTDSNYFVSLAVVDTKKKLAYWINSIGGVTDIVQLTDIAYGKIISKRITPFKYYHDLITDCIHLYDAAIFKYRFPKARIYLKNVPDYDKSAAAMMGFPAFIKAKKPLEKLAALYKERQRYIGKLVYSTMRHPDKIAQDTIYSRYLAGIKKGEVTVSERTDSSGSAVFYSTDDHSPVYKAMLDIRKARMYFYHQDQTVFDSLDIKRKKIEMLFNEGTDVFTLYQNYQLWKLAEVDSMAKLLDSYKAGKYASKKERSNTEAFLANYKGDAAEARARIRAVHRIILSKLDVLLASDLHFQEQELRDYLYNHRAYIKYGNYKNGQLVIYASPYEEGIRTITRGQEQYQLTDHRGNVLAVVSDKKIPHDDNNDGIVDYYTADVIKATDYSSFGAPLPGRSFQIKEYKYGYNGKEEDKETGYLDYGARMYDPNIGRFLSVDPLWKKNSYESNYSYANNTPILMIDRDGKDGIVSITRNSNGKGGTITIATTVYVHAQVSANTTVELAYSKIEAKRRNDYLEKNKEGLKGAYVDVNGDTWNINLKINYVAFEKGKSRVGAGENELFLNDVNTNEWSGRSPAGGSVVLGKKEIEPPSAGNPAGKSQNILRKFTGNKSFIGKNLSEGNQNTKTHEQLHLFGLGERYGRASESNVPKIDVMYEGSETAPLSIDQVHWNNWGRSILETSQNFDKYKADTKYNLSGTNKDNFILNWSVDSDGGALPFGQYNLNSDGSKTLKDPKANLGYEP